MASAEDNNNFLREMFKNIQLDNIIEWIMHNMEPEEIFGSDRLHLWAEENGYEEKQE